MEMLLAFAPFKNWEREVSLPGAEVNQALRGALSLLKCSILHRSSTWVQSIPFPMLDCVLGIQVSEWA